MKRLNLNYLAISIIVLLKIDLCPSQIVELCPFNGRLEIYTDKEIYFIYEPINVNIFFENLGDDTVRKYIMKIVEDLHIIDSKGKKYYNCCIADPLNSPGDRIFPGSGFEQNVELGSRYGVGRQPDKYYISLEMHVNPFWDRKRNILFQYYPLKTDTLEITLVEPEGEEADALYLYKRGLKWKEEKNWNLALYDFETLIKNFPESVYIPRAEKEIYRILKFYIK